MSASRSDHISKAEKLLNEWVNIPTDPDDMISHHRHAMAVELLMAAQAHATLANAMKPL